MLSISRLNRATFEDCDFSGMAYQWSFVKQHHLTVLNLDLKPIFLRSIFYSLYLSLYYSHGNVFFVFSLIYDRKALLIRVCRYALYKLVNYYYYYFLFAARLAFWVISILRRDGCHAILIWYFIYKCGATRSYWQNIAPVVFFGSQNSPKLPW